MRTPWKIGTEYGWLYFLANSSGAGVAGESANVLTKLFLDSAISAVVVTVTEVDAVNAAGWYKITFTPDAEGYWLCWARHATHEPEGAQEEIQVGAGALDALLDVANAVDGYTLRQVLKVLGAAAAGKGEGSVANPYRSLDDTADRIAAVRAGGLRTSVTLTP